MNKEISTTYGKEISLNGYSLEILNSALQTYILRGIVDKAIYTGIELDIFKCIAGGERIFKDLIRNLKLIYLQDLGVSAFGIWKDLDEMFELIQTSEDKGEKTKTVINIINTFAKNNHSQLGSHFNVIYNMKNKEEIKEYLIYFPTVKKIYESIDAKSLNKNLNDTTVLKKIYYESLKNKDLDSFYWARFIDENKNIKKSDKKNIIFDTYTQVLEDEGKIDSISHIAKKWYSELDTLKGKFLTYYIPIIFWTINKGYYGKIFESDDWKVYVYKNIIKPIKFVFDLSTKEDSISNELTYNELKDFYLFSNLLIDENILDEKYLKTYIDYSNLFPLTNYSMYTIKIDNEEFKSVEHYYQAMKFTEDIDMFEKIKNSKTSLDAKRLGEEKSYENKNEAISVLKKALSVKFSQHPDLKKLLSKTKGEIIYKISDPFLGSSFENEGENIVGKILQKIRDKKIKPDSVFYFENKPEKLKKSKSYFAFDIDGTLVSPSNILLPNVKNVLQKIYKDGKNIVLISNQKRRKTGDPKLKQKLEKIASQIDLPFIAFCAREEDQYRKPNSGIYTLIPESFGKIEMYIGDAAGRRRDHSDDDLKFAENLEIPFEVPEKFFK